MSQPVRVLQFTIGGPEFTGIASFLYQYYQKMDHKRVHYDFLFGRQNSMKLVCDDPIFEDAEFIELNAVKRKNAVSYHKLYKGLKRVLQSGNYDALHINTHRVGITLLCTVIARKCKVPVVTSHSHNTRFSVSPNGRAGRIRSALKDLCASFIRKRCDYLFACSENAGEALFGKKGVSQSNFRVLKNAIDSQKYIFDAQVRNEVRQSIGVEESCFVLGQVGRLSVQKNQVFSMQVFADILKNVPDAELWLIGTGSDQEKLETETGRLGIAGQVRFLGERSDVHKLMQGMDVFLFPSVYEGLGIVAIEAQAAGLPTFASAAVPKETEITGLIHYLPLTEGTQEWVQQILQYSSHIQRASQQDAIKSSGYDISEAAKWLEDFYVKVLHN